MTDLPPAIARAFVEAMEAYYAEADPAKQGQIAVCPPSSVNRCDQQAPDHSGLARSGLDEGTGQAGWSPGEDFEES
ncbi:hypothetical protein [Bradyrhizobium sp. SZCCHNRI1003]|uniref:hypothetical protein n=1 Tax=Bradyrhizobium sp. SZCCHNRI1003 TaxID=3057275 RepID=UPI002916FC88|nr:hypothetical protein [Bradyrhizobium sp. SZCCHNRI1003]